MLSPFNSCSFTFVLNVDAHCIRDFYCKLLQTPFGSISTRQVQGIALEEATYVP